MESVSGRTADRISVLVADNSRIHTQLLSDALQRDPGLAIVNWDRNSSSLIPTALTHKIDVLVISAALDGQAAQGLEVVRELHTLSARTKSVILLDSHEDEAVINAFRAGAKGIFSREGSVEMFCKCIHSVHQGEIWADRRAVSLAIDALASTPVLCTAGANGLNLLSKRELEVVKCVVQGLTNREIAQCMGLSRHTIKNYLFRVFDKLGVSSRVELLFMTLSQNNNPEQPLVSDSSKNVSESDHYDEPTLAFLEKAAEKGLPAAQLALAQAHLARHAGSEDVVSAYMWYLIATERMSQTRVNVTKMLTPNQVDEAQQKASIWLARMKQVPTSPVRPAAIKLAPLRQAM